MLMLLYMDEIRSHIHHHQPVYVIYSLGFGATFFLLAPSYSNLLIYTLSILNCKSFAVSGRCWWLVHGAKGPAWPPWVRTPVTAVFPCKCTGMRRKESLVKKN
jgi:hypothetical protein